MASAPAFSTEWDVRRREHEWMDKLRFAATEKIHSSSKHLPTRSGRRVFGRSGALTPPRSAEKSPLAARLDANRVTRGAEPTN
ncbi:hypothetical protein FA13DRAFT_1743140 [Coprinellus micaceus]|uniref:Uncharacterized protein n=1 Tax=Coprinellus micaceus TaxID=71717 RepID=A0A4Y7SEU2_COPMI|nr:hypothetical protein FA13DRAFT_1743140 [Coprinellus micaceus]